MSKQQEETPKQQEEIKFRSIEVVTETVTPQSAFEYLKTNQNNRPIDRGVVNYYIDQMRKGNWQLTPQGVSFDQYGQLLDGQHRLTAIYESKLKQRMIVGRGFDRDAFKVIDTGKRRTATDIFHLESIKNAALTSAGIRRYLMLSKGIITRESAFKVQISTTELLSVFDENKEVIEKIATMGHRNYVRLRIITGADTLGYFLFLHLEKKYAPELIEDFFEQVSTNSINFAINDFKFKVMDTKRGSHKLRAKVKHAYLVLAWNSFVTGTEVKELIYNINDPIPVFLSDADAKKIRKENEAKISIKDDTAQEKAS